MKWKGREFDPFFLIFMSQLSWQTHVCSLHMKQYNPEQPYILSHVHTAVSVYMSVLCDKQNQ